MKPRKRNKSKRHKNNKTEEIPKTHQIVIGYGTLSEIIVDKMITKIISLVISKSLTKKLYSDESVGTFDKNITFDIQGFKLTRSKTITINSSKTVEITGTGKR